MTDDLLLLLLLLICNELLLLCNVYLCTSHIWLHSFVDMAKTIKDPQLHGVLF
jgi:hypothetical protein